MEHHSYRTWGRRPYKVVVIHGGPGAPGSVATVAKELSKVTGVLEPFQTKATVQGQILELRDFLEDQSDLPVVLVGHSWGAWLSFIVAARYPGLVKKLILVAAGPFEQKYAESIVPERFNRLSEEERVEALNLIGVINGDAVGDKDKSIGRLGALFAKADAYEALPPDKDTEPLPASEEINRKVWAEAEALRKSGELLQLGNKIRCPVAAIHGDYDPHDAEGVRTPLSHVLKDFRFILLRRCGHEPWVERYARDEFLRVLRKEIT